jgi:MFS family permease
MSDHLGRKPLIVAGMLLQGIAIGALAIPAGFDWWLAAGVVLGAGTALVYPTLIAVIGDSTPPRERATAIGVYRLWRDSGYAAGAIVAGAVADVAGFSAAIVSVGALTALSGIGAWVRMREGARV